MVGSATYLEPDELLQLGRFEVGRQEPAQALIYYKMAIELDPDRSEAHYLIALLHAEMGLVERAIEELGQALQLQDDFPAARLHLGNLRLQAGQLTEARSTWLPLQTLDDDNALQAYMNGSLMLAEGNAEGYAEFEAAVQAGTGDPHLLQNMATVLNEASSAGALQAEPSVWRNGDSPLEEWHTPIANAPGELFPLITGHGAAIAISGITPSLFRSTSVPASYCENSEQ